MHIIRLHHILYQVDEIFLIAIFIYKKMTPITGGHHFIIDDKLYSCSTVYSSYNHSYKQS